MSTPEIRVGDSDLAELEPAVVQSERRRSEWLMTLSEAWRMGRTKIGVGIFLVIIAIAVVGPWVAPYSPTELVAPPFSAPDIPKLWLGSDYIGRDVLTRVLYGGRTVILLALAATVIGLGVGVTLGLITGYARRWIDNRTTPKGQPLHPALWSLLPAHIEWLLIGWVAQLTLGVAFWILPRRWQEPRRGNTTGATIALFLLNAGIVLVSLGAVFGLGPWATAVGRLLQIAAAVAFAHSAWPRIVGRDG